MGKAAIPFGSQTKLIGGNTIVAANGRYITLDSSNDCQNLSVTTSVGSSALTVAIKTDAGTDATSLDVINVAMRNATSATGTYLVRTITGALSMVVSSGSTLGHTSAIAAYIYVYLLDNSGTLEVALSSARYDDGAIVSTTAEGGAGAADSATAIYSTTARSNVPIRLVARLTSTQATAGTWATNMSQISLGNIFIPASKYQIKSLAGDFTGPTTNATEVTDLTFSNIVAGKVYKASLTTLVTSAGHLFLSWGDGSDVDTCRYWRANVSNVTVTHTMIFKAIQTGVKIYFSSDSGTGKLVRADSNAAPSGFSTPFLTTYLIIECLENYDIGASL